MSLAVSNSELQTWKQCRRKWYLAYYLTWGVRPEDEPATGSRQLGSRVHVALERLYGYGEDPLTTIAQLYAGLREERPDAAEELTKEEDYARAMLEGYLQWTAEQGVDEGLRVVSVEADVRAPSGVTYEGQPVELRGRLDQRVEREHDGARLFLDHKTVTSLTQYNATLAIDEQMKTYGLLEFLDALAKTGSGPAVRTDGGLYNALKRVKRTARATPPFYERVEVRHNVEELRSMWLRVQRVIEEIIAARVALAAPGADHRYLVPPTPSRDCSWRCPYLAICPLMDDGSRWEQALASNYDQVDPYAYYENGSEPGGGSE